ncbi:MAG: AAA family ATPase [Aquabacterium sp.]
MPALVIAVLGAESTGKTTLARTLAERLAQDTGLRSTWVDEWLRNWCDQHGRTPQVHEQAAIAAEQQARIDAACQAHDIVVADTTAIMTAIYSGLLFGDRSLDAQALAWQRDMSITLVTALDLPWVADGLQRDGAHVRAPVDDQLQALLTQGGIAFHRIAGSGPARLSAALAAVQAARLS